MPNKDLRSNIAADLAIYAAIIADGTIEGQIIDTAHYDGGIMLSFAVLAYLDGLHIVLLQESEDSGMAFPSTIPADRLIGSLPDLSAADSVGDALQTIGFRWTKRYVQLIIVSSVVTSGATIVAMTHKVPEIKPVE